MSASIKRAFLVLGLLALLVQSAKGAFANVTFNLQDFTTVVVTNKPVEIFPYSTPFNTNSAIILSDRKRYTTDAAGSFTVTNMVPGCYLVQATGPWTMTPFNICFTNNTGDLNAHDLLTLVVPVVDARANFVQQSGGVLVSPTNFFSANMSAIQGVALDVLAGGHVRLRTTNVATHNAAGTLTGNTNFFAANLLQGTNVVLTTNALGQLTISATGEGGTPIVNAVTHDGAGAIADPVSFFPVNVLRGTNMVFTTNAGKLTISSWVGTNFLQQNLIPGTSITFTTNGAGQITIASAATVANAVTHDGAGSILDPIEFFPNNILPGTNIVFATNAGKLTISAGEGGAVINPVTHDGGGLIASPVNLFEANLLQGANITLTPNGSGQVTISGAAATVNPVTHDGAGSILSPATFFPVNVLPGGNMYFATNAGKLTLTAGLTTNAVIHDGAGTISSPANFIHANILLGTNMVFATNGLGKLTLSSWVGTNFLQQHLVPGDQVSFTTNAAGVITIATTGLGSATNAILMLNGVGTNTLIYSGAAGSLPLGVTGFTGQTEDLFRVNTATAVKLAVNAAGGLELYAVKTDASNYERMSISGNTIAMQTAGTGADNLDLNLTTPGTGRILVGNAIVTTNLVLRDVAGNQEHSFTLADIAGSLANKLWTTNPVVSPQLLAGNTDGTMFWMKTNGLGGAVPAYTNNIEIWLSPRTDADGDGSMSNPRRADTDTAFDAIMRAHAGQSNITFRLHPGRFYTRGYSDNAALGPSSTWQLGRNWKIIGSGIDITYVIMTNTIPNTTASDRIFYKVIGADHGVDSSYSEVAEMTVDCNLDNLTSAGNVNKNIAAVKLNGSHTIIRKVKAINFGSDGNNDTADNDDCFVLSAAATFPQHSPRATHTLIEGCIVMNASPLTTLHINEFIHTSGAMNIAGGLTAMSTNIVLRNNFIDGRMSDGNLPAAGVKFWHGLTIGACQLGIVEGNHVQNIHTAGTYQDSFRSRSIICRNNTYLDVNGAGYWNFVDFVGEPAQGLNITSIVAGGVGGLDATVTTELPHDLEPDLDIVRITGVTGAGNESYNGDFVVKSVSGNTFTYTMTNTVADSPGPTGTRKWRIHRGVGTILYTGNTHMLRHGIGARWAFAAVGPTNLSHLPFFHNVTVANNYFGFSDGRPTNNFNGTNGLGVYIRNAKNAIVRDNVFNMYTNANWFQRGHVYVRNNSNYIIFNNRSVDGTPEWGYDATGSPFTPAVRLHDHQSTMALRIYETNNGTEYFQIQGGVMTSNVIVMAPLSNAPAGYLLNTDGGHPAQLGWFKGLTVKDGVATHNNIHTITVTDGTLTQPDGTNTVLITIGSGGGGSGIPLLDGTGTRTTFTTSAVGQTNITVRASSGQTGPLQSWVSSLGTALATVTPAGTLRLPDGVTNGLAIGRLADADDGIYFGTDLVRFSFNGRLPFDVGVSGITHQNPTAYFSMGIGGLSITNNDIRFTSTGAGGVRLDRAAADSRGSIQGSNAVWVGKSSLLGPVTHTNIVLTGTAPTINGNLGNLFSLTLTGDTDFTIGDLQEGATTVVVNNPGDFDVSWTLRTNQWQNMNAGEAPMAAWTNVTVYTFLRTGTLTNGFASSRGAPMATPLVIPYAATMNLDFAASPEVTIDLTGNVTAFTTSGKVVGKIRPLTVTMNATGGARTFTTNCFPAWRWMTPIPSSLASGTWGVLSLKCYTNNDVGVTASWSPQVD